MLGKEIPIMFFAIIDACTDISRLSTVCYGDSLYDIARWFADEFNDTYDMYRDDSENEEADGKKVSEQCEELCSLAKQGAIETNDLEGISFAVSGLTVEIHGVYDDFIVFCDEFSKFVKDKPKYVKIIPDKTASSFIDECDRLNTLLIKASI